VGRPRTIWLRTIDDDVHPQNFGVHKGKGQGGLATIRQYGNALLGVLYQEEQEEQQQQYSNIWISVTFTVIFNCFYFFLYVLL